MSTIYKINNQLRLNIVQPKEIVIDHRIEQRKSGNTYIERNVPSTMIYTPKLDTLKKLLEQDCLINYIKNSNPNQDLLPKHHYMVHYPRAIEMMGPLIYMWSMRYEGKHFFFKNMTHKLGNFKNLAKILAWRHQEMYTININFDLSLFH